MGDFHLGIWIFLVFSWMIVPGDSCPKQIPGLGQPSRLLGRQWLKSPTAWWWAPGTHLHFSQIAWLITVLPPGTVYVLNLMIHQTFLRKVLHKCVRIHLESRVGDAFWSTSVRKPVAKMWIWGSQFPITLVHVIGNLLASCGSFSGSYNLKACLKISNHSDDVNKHCVCVWMWGDTYISAFGVVNPPKINYV